MIKCLCKKGFCVYVVVGRYKGIETKFVMN